MAGADSGCFLIPALKEALSDRVGRRPVYMAGALGAAVWAFAFFPLLNTGSWWGVVAAATGGLVFHALMYGPQAAFIAELFDTRVRYSGASMGYQVAGIFGGALAPIIATALLAWSGSWVAVSLYVVAALRSPWLRCWWRGRRLARISSRVRARRFVREPERERTSTAAG